MTQHKDLANGRWASMSLPEQMGNIGSETSRMVKRLESSSNTAQNAFERALELIDLTIKFAKRPTILREVCRMREFLCGAYLKKDIDELKAIDRYLFQFALAARWNR